MMGTISIYQPDVETGIVQTADGEQYVFTKSAWVFSGIEPVKGLAVIFELDGRSVSAILPSAS